LGGFVEFYEEVAVFEFVLLVLRQRIDIITHHVGSQAKVPSAVVDMFPLGIVVVELGTLVVVAADQDV
jgi:hypothetical protein